MRIASLVFHIRAASFRTRVTRQLPQPVWNLTRVAVAPKPARLGAVDGGGAEGAVVVMHAAAAQRDGLAWSGLGLGLGLGVGVGLGVGFECATS